MSYVCQTVVLRTPAATYNMCVRSTENRGTQETVWQIVARRSRHAVLKSVVDALKSVRDVLNSVHVVHKRVHGERTGLFRFDAANGSTFGFNTVDQFGLRDFVRSWTAPDSLRCAARLWHLTTCDPKATKSERECAVFLVQRFDIDLAKKLRRKTRAR